MARALLKTAVLLFALSAAGCFAAFYHLSYKWRACFNEAGRCFDPLSGAVYTAQSGGVWLGLGALCSMAALYLLRRLAVPPRGDGRNA
ncbi:hypothetical protein [Litorivita sp. NS0012-18]|uniref:hypothetical protein n=1 Tax=Litorivita sp. NS0012-18 TaxID=3127655 RepID=UPI00310B6CF9